MKDPREDLVEVFMKICNIWVWDFIDGGASYQFEYLQSDNKDKSVETR
jgi:hypothetical protein